MNWYKKLMPSKIRLEGKFRKKKQKQMPEGLWQKCSKCGSFLYKSELERNNEVCPKCNYHMRIGARKRLALFLDEHPQLEIAGNIYPKDFLKFKDSKKYKDRLTQAQKSTGENDALVAIKGKVNGIALVATAFEFDFMGGSMGSVVGEKFVHAANTSLNERIPLVCFSSSGGARSSCFSFSDVKNSRDPWSFEKEQNSIYFRINRSDNGWCLSKPSNAG